MYPIIIAAMNDHRAALLHDIEAFLTSRKMAETTFGRLSVNDGKFVARIRAGGVMTLDTFERVRRFIRTEAQASTEAA